MISLQLTMICMIGLHW